MILLIFTFIFCRGISALHSSGISGLSPFQKCLCLRILEVKIYDALLFCFICFFSHFLLWLLVVVLNLGDKFTAVSLGCKPQWRSAVVACTWLIG